MRIAIVVADFNEEVTGLLLQDTLARLAEREIELDPELDVIHVPGAIEIPLIAQQYAVTDEYDAIICLGAVVQGQTDHYDYVCRFVNEGCLRVSLEFDIPVIFGVLTTETQQQALARANGQHSYKGRYCADAAIRMVEIMQRFEYDLEDQALESI